MNELAGFGCWTNREGSGRESVWIRFSRRAGAWTVKNAGKSLLRGSMSIRNRNSCRGV